MTLNSHYALYYITFLSFGAHHKNLNADRPILLAAKCSPVNVVSSDIRVMQTRRGSGDVGRQIRKWLYKHDKLTQRCRAFTLALARLSCTYYCDDFRHVESPITL